MVPTMMARPCGLIWLEHWGQMENPRCHHQCTRLEGYAVLRTVGVCYRTRWRSAVLCYALWCCYRSWWVVLRTVAAATAAGVVLPHTVRAVARPVCGSTTPAAVAAATVRSTTHQLR